jgi:hypothetical protein
MRAPDQTPNFDYSQAEWAEIEAAAQVIRKGPFPKKMRDSLRAAACVYVSEMARAQDGQTARELKKRWQKIAGSSEKLHDDLSACMEDLLCEISRKGSRTADEKGMMTWLDAISFNLGLLPTIAERAAHYFERHHDKSNPRLRFQSKILEVWVRLGGKLKISRHPKTQEVRGPLARFFFNVARPVMGAAAPSPDSLRDIVERQKIRMGEIAIFTEKPAGLSIFAWYDRLCEWVEMQAEKQERELEFDLEITRAIVGDSDPAVVAGCGSCGNASRD